MYGANSFGRMLIWLGLFFLIMGLLVSVLGKFLNLGRLPGDILIKKGNFTFFFPLATSIVISLVLTLILNLIFRR